MFLTTCHVQFVCTNTHTHTHTKDPNPGTYTDWRVLSELPPTRIDVADEVQLPRPADWVLKTNYLLTSAANGPGGSNTPSSKPLETYVREFFCRLNIGQTSLCLSGTCNPNNGAPLAAAGMEGNRYAIGASDEFGTPKGPDRASSGTVAQQSDETDSCYGSRQTLTSTSD